MLRTMLAALRSKVSPPLLVWGCLLLGATACSADVETSASPVCSVVTNDYGAHLKLLAEAPPNEREDLRGVMLVFSYPETFVAEASDRHSARLVRGGIESAPLDPDQTRRALSAFRDLQREPTCS